MNVITEYQVKPECVDEQVVALNQFAESVKAMANPNFKFTAYQLPDKVSFKHVTFIKDQETAELFMSQPFYKELGDGTIERAEIQPTFTPVDMVATFKG